MNNKDIYEAFNYMNFDEKEYENIPIEMNEIEKKRIKKNLIKNIKENKSMKKTKIAITAAAITLVCGVGIVGAAPDTLKNVPILNSIVQKLNDQSGYKGDFQKYVQAIGQTVKNNGLEITINEALCDDSKLIIGYTVKGDRDKKQLVSNGVGMPFLGNNIKINGKKEHFGGGLRIDHLDDNSIIAVCEMDLENKKLPKDFNVDLNIKEAFNIKGIWDFSFSVSKEDVEAKTTTFKPGTKIKLTGANIKIDKVMFSPINTSILLNGNYTDKKEAMKHGDGIFPYSDWFVFDDKGVEIAWKGAGGGTKGLLPNKFNYKYDFEVVKNIPKHLTVIPFKYNGYGKEKPEYVTKSLDSKYPIELNQGKIGKLIIKEVQNKEDKTIIKYRAEGKVPYFQAQNLSVKDELGEYIKPYEGYYTQRDKDNPNEFTLVLDKLKPNKKYFISTSILDDYELKEEYSFKIRLQR
ncbi:hypothetical protein N072000002_16770 [Clostridium tetani]|uniref:DUF4179 domain-containing protein n=1 Tax=Clostridium tetani TaxID=1513 RepID=A0A4Q0VFI3_CLOTA|nr:DUF4179 domain-containing protein [Clostridium tetani]RXI49857.1 DUF4179 domain-containing protein [Clostridium tetani]BDR81495.1 hypothetical protein K234311028_17410 [Clostridium tetani]BDR89876.1 hypothetical protein N072000002_16770 [Clostridium tetani]